MAVVTISRQFGAGGKTLGEMVAERLGYTFVSQEIITRIAEVARVSPTWVESIEKEAGTKLSKLIGRFASRSLMEKVLGTDQGYIDEQLFLDYLVVMIAQLAEEGNVVILGRGSQYILGDHPDAYHVLLIDELENRERFMRQHYQMSEREARHTVRNEDRRRLNLYRKIGKTDYDRAGLYHLVLNMGRMDLDTALDLVCRLVVT